MVASRFVETKVDGSAAIVADTRWTAKCIRRHTMQDILYECSISWNKLSSRFARLDSQDDDHFL